MNHGQRITRSLSFAGCTGILVALVACSDDTATPLTDGGLDSSIGNDAVAHDAPVSDSPIVDTGNDVAKPDGGLDAGGDGSVSEAGPPSDGGPVGDGSTPEAAPADGAPADSAAEADAKLQPPPPLNMCALLDSFWAGDRYSADGWVDQIASGPASPSDPDYGYTGFVNTAPYDCTIANLFPSPSPSDPAFADWTLAVLNFEQQFFGCGADAGVDGGVQFGLIPSSIYGQKLSTADLKRVGDWFVESINWAVANRAVTNPEAILSGDQIAQIEAQIAYDETLYPDIIVSSSYTQNSCPDAAAPEAGPAEAGPNDAGPKDAAGDGG